MHPLLSLRLGRRTMFMRVLASAASKSSESELGRDETLDLLPATHLKNRTALIILKPDIKCEEWAAASLELDELPNMFRGQRSGIEVEVVTVRNLDDTDRTILQPLHQHLPSLPLGIIECSEIAREVTSVVHTVLTHQRASF